MPAMALFFDVSTSAEFWRRIYPVDRAPSTASSKIPSECAYTATEVIRLLPKWADDLFLAPTSGRMHAYVFDPQHRRTTARHATHVWSAPIPNGSFHALSKDVYIASPEFSFLAAAGLLTERMLIAYGFELCGLYSFDHASDRGMRQRAVPLTTIEKIRRFLESAQGCPGRDKALQALRHVRERSASPMETFDVMALFGAYRLGGYNLGTPVLNLDVSLSERAGRIAKRGRCRPDICIPAAMLDIEHDGSYDHSGARNWSSDRARTNALKEMGFEVIELTEDQVKDLLAFEYIALRIAKIIGKRVDKSKLGATPARLALRDEVFAWNRSGGKLR